MTIINKTKNLDAFKLVVIGYNSLTIRQL